MKTFDKGRKVLCIKSVSRYSGFRVFCSTAKPLMTVESFWGLSVLLRKADERSPLEGGFGARFC